MAIRKIGLLVLGSTLVLGVTLMGSPLIAAQNLVLNGDFEQGKMYWTWVNANLAEGEGYNGSACAHIKFTPGDPTTAKYYVFSDPIDIDAKSEYTLQVWLKHTGDGVFWVHAWCYNESGQYVGDMLGGQIKERQEASEIWHRPFSYVTFPEGAKRIRLCLELISPRGGACEVWFDDVSLSIGRVPIIQFIIGTPAIVSEG